MIENPLFESPLVPVRLGPSDLFQFRCHPGISCFNRCCQNIDITLMPYDILVLKRFLELSASDFLAQYTVPFALDQDGLPGIRLRTHNDRPACLFLDETTGCRVYSARPTACRYYALGLLSIHEVGSGDQDGYFIVKEDHCLGHQDAQVQTIDAYRKTQDLDRYDSMTRDFRQIILKKRSLGPGVGKPSLKSFQLFFMAAYDLDRFRIFVGSSGFQETYLIDDALRATFSDDESLLSFAFRFLRQVLFDEVTIPPHPEAIANREKRKAFLSAGD